MQRSSLYDTHVAWYPLLDPRDQHAEECAEYVQAIHEALGLAGGSAPGAAPATLLELGGGAGNNAFHMKAHFACTVSDLSAQMLSLCADANPEVRCVPGDMRTLRLDATFDAVLVHDAIAHMASRADLRAALETAYVHLRPGGVALFVPDCVRESFVETADDDAHSDGLRHLQYVVRAWDPDPSDETTQTDYAFLLRGPEGVEALHVQHTEGLFAVETWRALLNDVGFVAEAVPRALPEGEGPGPYWDRFWRCSRAR